MDENKKDVFEEGVEDALDEIKEDVEDAAEEISKEIEEILEGTEESCEEELDSLEAEQYVDVNLLIDEVAELRRSNKMLKGILKAIVAVVVAAALAFGAIGLYKTFYNPYNHMGYYNMSEMTFEDFAEMSDVSMEEAIAMYGLPEDLKPDTYYDVIEFLIPLSYMARINGVDVEVVKEVFGFGDEITDKSTWGEALDSLTVGKYLELTSGEKSVEDLVSEYGLSGDVTEDTLWGEVRATVNKVDYERFLAEKATDVTDAE